MEDILPIFINQWTVNDTFFQVLEIYAHERAIGGGMHHIGELF